MLSHPLVNHHVTRAISTNNCTGLFKLLNDYPLLLVTAKRNINLAEHQKAECPFRPYPSRNDVQEHLSGPLNLGYVNEYSDKFGIDPDVFCLPCIIPGRVGGGKSHLILYLLLQILRQQRDFNVIIPDLKEKEYRHLFRYCKNLKVITKDRIKLNPLQAPAWMDPTDYIMFFSKVFTKENWLLTTSESILIKLLSYIYEVRGIFDGSQNWPTLKDLYNVISNRLEREKIFRFRDIYLLLQTRLDPYISSGHFDYQIGIPHDIWRTENVVLEMGKRFTDKMYTFLVSYISGLNYHYNIDHGLIGSKLRTLLNIDEGRILFKSRDVETFDESYINEFVTKFREPGIGIIVSSQETASFNQTIRSIAYTKICFPLTDGKDKAVIKGSFGLDEKQADFLFKLPKFGQAIVRYGGYQDPFLLAVPHFNPKKDVTDEEVESKMENFYNELDLKMKQTPLKKPLHVLEPMPPDSVALLFYLGKNPFTKVSDMTNAPGFKSPTEVTNALEWLEDHGYIKREKYKTSKIGRKAIFAVLTEKAFSYLGIKGIPGKGNFEHKWYQHIVFENLKKAGSTPKIECSMQGHQKSVDVLAYSNETGYIAYEISLHFENLISNIIKDFDSEVAQVFIVARDKESMKKAIKMVDDTPALSSCRQRISFCTISDFFD